ncbi:Lysine exporter protein (LYSE/YGGA) [Sulfobacillus acidophilus TPY]|uniref:Lysine exporter protein (LYSE/YGGA) n=1 Tax=Sulfobacillus acidophilus (strain ATCC 700253 / DSM 10332 / NAL) TaxID=679936 RepID=G8TY79_SULAD|nr:Lysine exporter protein (LYSE/YGGA) [Sulfobacillus acidophilus TPY]AEW03986.1 Lysine exporter protein (LYSE/YGGA) [Sulfobacillus acidophilus DSM 10332]
MDLAFLHGFLLALALILPLGPQNLTVISQGTTHRQYRRTVPVVITAALSDTILIGVAVLGVSAVAMVAPVLKEILTLLGIVFLVWMGWQSWHSLVHPETFGSAAPYWTLWRQIMYTLRASLLNPHAIMDTVIVIGGGAALYSTPREKWAYALAAVLVSWLWFFGLSLVGRALAQLRHQARTIKWLNRISAGIMWTIAGRYLIQLGIAIWTTPT